MLCTESKKTIKFFIVFYYCLNIYVFYLLLNLIYEKLLYLYKKLVIKIQMNIIIEKYY